MQLFFDLDHTLWDFEANARICLERVFEDHVRNKYNVTQEDFIAAFSAINRKLWERLERGEISHDFLRENRFRLVLESHLVAISAMENDAMNEHFLALLPEQTQLIPNCLEVLDYLKNRYPLHIISNGFQDVQQRKLHLSGIAAYFSSVVTNDTAGSRKPDSKIFNFALANAACKAKEGIMIGDSYEADILGAEKVGMKAYYFAPENTEKHPRHLPSLLALKNIF